jgi:ATP-binding cassette, subfamily B, multidrug efflux pump
MPACIGDSFWPRNWKERPDMWGDYGYIEEGHEGKVYNLRLLRRLYAYVIPFKRTLRIILAITVLVTALNLVLPYVTKLVVDQYIVPQWHHLDLKAAPGAVSMHFERAYPRVLEEAKLQGGFLRASALKEISPSDLHRYQQEALISKARYYFVRRTGAAQIVVDRNPVLFISDEKGWFIKWDELYKLPRNEVMILREKDFRGVMHLGLTFFAVLAAMFVLNYWEYYYLAYMSQRIMQNLRLSLFEHLLKRQMSFFDRYAVGRLVTRVTNDVQNLDEMFESTISILFRDLFLTAGIVAVLLKMNWRLALLCFSLTPLIIIVAILFSRLARSAFRELRATVAMINAFLQETFTGIKVIQSFARESIRLDGFRRINRQNYTAGMKQVRVFAVFMPLVEVFSSIAVAVIIWYGGVNVISQKLSLGSLVAFVGYLTMFFRPIREISEKYNSMQSAMASSERIFAFFDFNEEIRDPASPHNPIHAKGTIEFRDVTFGYSDGQPVLKNISFRVESGETVALVGHTGAGKTSIINLLERFYEPWSGSILVDDVDIRQWEKSRLRSRLGLVMQDVFLFAGNIAENITLGQRDIAPEDIEEACRQVNADQFIESMSQKYAHLIGEGGTGLSAGQRQLLAFARALAYNPFILLLDEATSNVDPETERLIQDALKRLMQQRTTLVVAHRLSTIQNAAKILVLHHGEIKESGTHHQLMALKGLYYRLNKLREANI